MNHYPNSTNKLFLQETTYPGDDKKTYFVAQAEVDKILALGLLPEFELSGVDFAPSAPKIAVMFTRDKHPDRDKADYSMPRATVESICLSGGRPCFISYEKATEQLQQCIKDIDVILDDDPYSLTREKHKQFVDKYGQLVTWGTPTNDQLIEMHFAYSKCDTQQLAEQADKQSIEIDRLQQQRFKEVNDRLFNCIRDNHLGWWD